MAAAIENVLSFDHLNPSVRRKVASIFHRFGIPVFAESQLLPLSVETYGNWTVQNMDPKTELGLGSGESSTPRFQPQSPKHGKIDPENKPHVGGNTWAGGTGGTDTAGLGGVGGPYRLDLRNQPTQQISQEIKDKWSKESREKAKEMAKEALKKALADISMGAKEWEFYSHYRQVLQPEITQLRSLLKESARRRCERVWLRNQNQGELDDSKLIDGLAGEAMIFKKRGVPNADDSFYSAAPLPVLGADGANGSGQVVRKLFQFVVDVSG